VLAQLKVEKAGLEGERKKVEADLGPVRYLAELDKLLREKRQEILEWLQERRDIAERHANRLEPSIGPF
jgi:hypothetical protein